MSKAILSIFFALAAALPLGAAEGPVYLLTERDPSFLARNEVYLSVAYDKGRTRLVRPVLPYGDLPPELRAALKPVSMGDVRNAPAGSFAKVEEDHFVRELVSRVNPRNISAWAERLTMTGKRSAGALDLGPASGNRLAADMIAAELGRLGYAAEQHCYRKRRQDDECNVVGRREGEKYILVAAHFDTVGHENAGADDNASGTAALLEMARVLAGYRSDLGLIFLAANGEEIGIAGSYAYARKLKASGEISKIAWAINMDMVAYNKDGVIELETNREFAAHAEWVAALARVYTRMEPHVAMPAWGSDHVPFLEAGIPAYLSIEHWDNHNPCYHRPCDTMQGLDWDFAADIARLNLAVIAGKSRLTPN
ncbi:MAG TPA: hypothetical protein DDW67_07825 [Elusimicrobia bacterium]|nr:hypothetical protein [Elusimicrobiota bacterium]